MVNRTSTMKPVDEKSSTDIDFNVENNDKDAKFEIGENVKISNYSRKKLL